MLEYDHFKETFEAAVGHTIHHKYKDQTSMQVREREIMQILMSCTCTE